MISVTEDGRRKGVKLKIKGRKLRNVIYCQGALKQNRRRARIRCIESLTRGQGGTKISGCGLDSSCWSSIQYLPVSVCLIDPVSCPV